MSERDKRFLVFGYDQYYPSGGLGDLEGSFDTVNEAVIFMKKGKPMKNYKGDTIYSSSEFYDVYDRIKGIHIDTKYYE